MTRHSLGTMKKTVCAVALLATSAFSQEVKADVVYWDNGSFYPALYYFRTPPNPNASTGVRTVYPQRTIQSGQTAGFAWSVNQNNVLIMRYPDGFVDQFQLIKYDQQHDIMYRNALGQSVFAGPGPWYGCRSGGIPPIIAQSLCVPAQQGKVK